MALTRSKYYISSLCARLTVSISRAEALKPYLNTGHWISPAINPFANLTSVFFMAMDEAEVGDEDVNQSSEMSVYVSYSRVISTEITSSDKKEELRIFDEIMKLVPSFKHVVMACSEHRRALLNLIKMVSSGNLVFL